MAGKVYPSLRSLDYQPGDPNLNTTPWMAPGEIFTFILHIDIESGTPPSLPNTREQDALSTVKATSVLCNQSFERVFRTGICGGQGCGPGVTVGAYKYDVPDPVESGGILEYNLVLFNGFTNNQQIPQNVTGIRLKDIFPSSQFVKSIISVDEPVYERAGGSASYDATTHTWTFAVLPPRTTTIKVKVQLQDNIPNNTVIENKLELYYDPTSTTTPVSTYIEKTTVVSAPNLWIKKTADKENVEAGDVITYTITYGNIGSYFAGLAELFDDYDEKYLEILSISGGTADASNTLNPLAYVDDGAKIKWNLRNVPIGGTGTVSYTAKVKEGTYPSGTILIPNTANIQDANTWTDKDFSDNIANHFVNLTTLADLKLTKTVNHDKILAINSTDGESLTYTISIANIGVADILATDGGYSVTDILPAGLSYVSNTSGVVPTIDNNTLTWNFPNAALSADGAPHSFNVIVQGVNFDQIGKILKNKASVELNSTLSEPNYKNNVDSAETLVVRNLWVGTANSTDWATASNWTYFIPGDENYSNIDYYKDVEFATLSNHFTPAVNDLHLDENRKIRNLINQTVTSTTPAATPKTLVIPTGKTLVVEGTAETLTNEHILIKSALGQGNGALVFTQPNLNKNVKATVEYDSKSQKVTAGTYPREWQFIGTPVSGATPISVFGSNVSGSKYGPAASVLIRKYNESKPDDPSDIGEKWDDANTSVPMVSFAGYEVVQPTSNTDPGIFEFKGILNVGDFPTSDLGFTPGVYFRGNYVLANSYVAPIRIDKLLAADFKNLEQTIYLYNTGSRDQWITNSGYNNLGRSTVAGTYYAVPINNASTFGLDQIPSMNGFLVRRLPTATWVESDPIEFNFRYASLATDIESANYPATQQMFVKRQGNAPKAAIESSGNKYPLLKIDVESSKQADRVLLVTAPNTTKKFDNGWDGFKFRTQTDAQIYAFADGADRFQVSTDENLDGTVLGFYNGSKETDFTLKFHYQDMENVYGVLQLQDLVTGSIIDITDGGSYQFSASATSPESRFRLIGVKIPDKPADLNNPIEIINHNNHYVTVSNESGETGSLRIYDVAGKLMEERTMTSGLNIEKLNLNKGLYILEAVTGSNRASLKVAIQ